MNIKTNLKYIWSVCAIAALGLFLYSWLSGSESAALLNTLLALDALLLILSIPCSFFAGAVVFFAWYVLEMNPLSIEGAYLNTVFLGALGAAQWFWLTRFWYPTENPFQKLDLLGAGSD